MRRGRPSREAFRGRWRVVSAPTWDADALDDPEPAELTFGAGRAGELHFIGISASVDYRVVEHDGAPVAEFSWAGEDLDGHSVSGRGWARRTPEGLAGRLFIHESDDSVVQGDAVSWPSTRFVSSPMIAARAASPAPSTSTRSTTATRA